MSSKLSVFAVFWRQASPGASFFKQPLILVEAISSRIEDTVAKPCNEKTRRRWVKFLDDFCEGSPLGSSTYPLLRRQRRLLRWWHRVRDGTLARPDFIEQVECLRAGFKAELEATTALPMAHAEKTPLAKIIRTCQQRLQIEPALYGDGDHDQNHVAGVAGRPRSQDSSRVFRHSSKSCARTLGSALG